MSEPAPAPTPTPNYVALKARLEAAQTEVEGRLAVAKTRATEGSYLRQQYQGDVDALEGELLAIKEAIEDAASKIPPEEPPAGTTQSPPP